MEDVLKFADTFRSALAIYPLRVVLLHKIPDLIYAGKTTAKELAAETNLNEDMLYRVVRAVAIAGFVKFDEKTKSFELTEAGQYMRSDHPESYAPFFLFKSFPVRLEGLARFEDSVRTGTDCIELATGGNFYSYCSGHRETRDTFDSVMSAIVGGGEYHKVMATSVPLDGINTIVDYGGGQGNLCLSLVKRCPGLKAICFDLPEVVGKTQVSHKNLSFVGGDLFVPESLPVGADAAILATILHNWSDKDCKTFLQNIRQSLSVGGKLFISEMLVTNTSPVTHLQVDVEMMTLFAGRERNLDEFLVMTTAAGFELEEEYGGSNWAHVIKFVCV